MAEQLVTVVANAPYPVALESGRHLHPGAIAEIALTERVKHQIAARALVVVELPAPVAAPAPSSKSTPVRQVSAPESDTSEEE